MKRRDSAGSAACSLVAWTGQALAQSGPLTKIIFPVCGRRWRRRAMSVAGAAHRALLDRNIIVENRTGGDGLIGIKAVRKGPILMAPPSSSPRGRRCICCRWWRPRRAMIRERFRAGFASSCGSSSCVFVGDAARRRRGLQAIRRLDEGQSVDKRRTACPPAAPSSFHRLSARGDARRRAVARGLSRLGADHQ